MYKCVLSFIPWQLIVCVTSCCLSLGANNTGKLSTSGVDWTWQWSTLNFNRVDQCLVLCRSTNCDLRCLVPANVAGASMTVWITDRCRRVCRPQISRVLCGPAVRTLCSCWNHEDRWPTSHVANCTRRWVITKWSTAVVDSREYVSIKQFILYSRNFSRILISIGIIFPLWIVR